MDQPLSEVLLSVDFSLDRIDVQLRQSDQVIWPHQAYANNWPGYEALQTDLLEALAQSGADRLVAVGESTGPYWWHLFYQLSHHAKLADYQPQVSVLNPLHIKRFRQALPEQDKTDQLDPGLIAHYYRTLGQSRPYQFNDRYQALRFLSRAYFRVIHTLAAENAYCLSVLYLTASDYQRVKPFSDLFSLTSAQMMLDYPDVQAIADLDLETLTEQLQRLGKGHFAQPHDNAQKLQQVAQHSYPIPAHLQAVLYPILTFTLDHIRFLTRQKERYLQLIEQHLDTLPEAQDLLHFEGLGPVLVSGFLAEIQDARRFTTGHKFDRRRNRYRPRTYRDGQASVAKLAGLWWPKNASGRSANTHAKLARERNPYLRYWFGQAAHSLRRSQPDYAHYYLLKSQEGSPSPRKRALVLTARKAVRLVFALLHKAQSDHLEELPIA